MNNDDFRAVFLCNRIEDELRYLETKGIYYTITEFNQELFDLSTRLLVLRLTEERFKDYLRRNSSRYSSAQKETKERRIGTLQRIGKGSYTGFD